MITIRIKTMGKLNGSIFTLINDCVCDIRLVYGEVDDKLQFIVGKES